MLKLRLAPEKGKTAKEDSKESLSEGTGDFERPSAETSASTTDPTGKETSPVKNGDPNQNDQLNPGDDRDSSLPNEPLTPALKFKFEDKSSSPAASALKLSLNLGQQRSKIKVKPAKPVIEGYDSEAPDREEDPTIQEAIVLRVLPSAGLEALTKKVETNNLQGFHIKFEDARRALITIDDKFYAGHLVDLPTVTEAHKTFDRKNIYKSADVCQMLLVTKELEKEEDMAQALRAEPQQFPHGINPPLHNVRNRRFHHRISNKVIETVEAKVDELFKKDGMAQSVNYELLPASAVAQSSLQGSVIVDDAQVGTQSEEENSDGQENDYHTLDMELAKALQDENSERESDSEEDEFEEDEEEGENVHKLLREEIRELQATIDAKQSDADSTVNQIIKGRLIDAVSRMRKELEMKTGLLQDAEESARAAASIPAHEEDPEEEEADVDAEAGGEGEGEGDALDALTETAPQRPEPQDKPEHREDEMDIDELF